MQQLGLDIGGSGIKGAIVDTKTGEFVSERFKIETPRPAEPHAVAEKVKDMVDHFNWKGPVGCCFPTIMKNGVAKSWGNLEPEWEGVNVENLFSDYTGLIFKIGNDADLAGVCEMSLGAGKGLEGKVVVITIGTGLGSGFFYNGVLVPNMEFGRMFHTNGEPIEFYSADSARKKENLSLKKWSKRFDFFLTHLCRIISPDHIIIGGGVSKKFEEFRDTLSIDVPITVAKFRNQAGIVGAALYVQSNDYGVR